MNARKQKPMQPQQVQLAQIMMPEHANTHGNVHGGWIMKLMDEAGALAAIRYCGRRVVTVAIDQMSFHQPIRIGELITLTAAVNYTGNTSMEVEVHVITEDPLTGKKSRTNTAYLVYVAIGEDGRPVQVPSLVANTPEEHARLEAGCARQQRRQMSTRKDDSG